MAIIALTGAWIAFPAFLPGEDGVCEGMTEVVITVGTPTGMVVLKGTLMVVVTMVVPILAEAPVVADSVGEEVPVSAAEALRAKTAAAMMEVVATFMFVLSEWGSKRD
jgi:hypothetical protein